MNPRSVKIPNTRECIVTKEELMNTVGYSPVPLFAFSPAKKALKPLLTKSSHNH